MQTKKVYVKSILTRTSGFLQTVCSHSLQPYRGCAFGSSLCGVGCYVQHNTFLTRGALWGSFLEARLNAAEAYQSQYSKERRWARHSRAQFSIFMSSSTDPFVPQEKGFRVTQQILEAMLAKPPDVLIVQTHTHLVTTYLKLYLVLANVCQLRFHISIESDRDRLPGLPAPASPVKRRFEAASILKQAGFKVVITVAPLLPIQDPEAFFKSIAARADAVVLDHFIEGDGTPNGMRTKKTLLPPAMSMIDPESTFLSYRDQMVTIAQRIMPGRVGVSIDGFAGRFLSTKKGLDYA